MNLTLLGWAYLLSFFLGLGYTLVSFFLMEAGGHGEGASDHASDHGSHGDASGALDFPLSSPLTIALGLATFGGVGTVMNVMGRPGYVTFPVATLAGMAMWGAAFLFFFKLFRVTQGSSEAVVSQLIGKEGVVTVTIPTNGLGEISYVARGTHYNAPASSEGETIIKQGCRITIVSIDHGVCKVRESIDERLSRLDTPKEEV